MKLLDVMTALGRLDFGDFQTVFQAIYPDRNDYALWKMRRDLVALGHIHLDHARRKISVVKPRLCLLPAYGGASCKAVLIGLRNEKILEELVNCPAHLDVSILPTSNGDYPRRVLLSGSHHHLFKLADEFRTVPLTLSDNPGIPDAWRLLQEIQGVRQMLEGHFSIRQPAPGGAGFDTWSVFEPLSCRFTIWEQARNNYHHDLMLIRRSPYRHWIARKKNTGEWDFWQNDFSSDPLWAKWAVVQSGPDREACLPQAGRGKFRISAKLPLPIELHRVSCLCSGFAPIENDGWIEYQDVPLVVQHGIRQRLSAG